LLLALGVRRGFLLRAAPCVLRAALFDRREGSLGAKGLKPWRCGVESIRGGGVAAGVRVEQSQPHVYRNFQGNRFPTSTFIAISRKTGFQPPRLSKFPSIVISKKPVFCVCHDFKEVNFSAILATHNKDGEEINMQDAYDAKFEFESLTFTQNAIAVSFVSTADPDVKAQHRVLNTEGLKEPVSVAAALDLLKYWINSRFDEEGYLCQSSKDQARARDPKQ